MKKPLIVFLIAFAVSLGAGAGLAVMRAPKPLPVPAGEKNAKHASATAHDTATHDSAAAPGATPTPEETDKGIPHVASAERNEGTPSKTAAAATEPTTKQLAVNTKAADSALTMRLAHIFAAMQPKDAAHVLEQMDNHDIQVILLELSNKQQASILSNLPVQRAAAIARETLRGSASAP
jgi:hypothetical protein